MAQTSNDTSVGKEALSYCTSCKIDLAHIIVSMKGDKIAKVECKTCKKTHAFRAPKGITEPPKAKTKKSAKKSESTSVEDEWQKLMTASRDIPAQSYNTRNSFKLGDKIRHTKFGEGIVGKIIYPNKIQVVFQMDVKTLVHTGIKFESVV